MQRPAKENLEATEKASHAEPSSTVLSTTDVVNVFIPIDIQSASNNKESYLLSLKEFYFRIPLSQFDAEFPYEKAADVLNHKSKKHIFQIGMTCDEAQEIVNHHSTYHPKLIVQVSIPKARLSETRQTEKEICPNMANARGSAYFLLQPNPNTTFTAKDIISISLMTSYYGTQRWSRGNYDWLWPGTTHVVENPCHLSSERLEEKRINDLKVQIALQELNKLINLLEGEMLRGGFVRFFTDFHGTKEKKLAELKKLVVKQYSSWETLSSKALAAMSVESVTYTSWPLQSRTAKLLNEISKNDGAALLTNYQLESQQPRHTPSSYYLHC